MTSFFSEYQAVLQVEPPLQKKPIICTMHFMAALRCAPLPHPHMLRLNPLQRTNLAAAIARHTHIVGLRALLLPLFVSNRQKRSCVLIDHSIVVRILSGSLGKLITARNTQMQLLLHAPSFRDNVATHSNPHAAQLSSSAINAPHHCSPGRAICCAAALAHRTCFPNVRKCNLVRGAVVAQRDAGPRASAGACR